MAVGRTTGSMSAAIGPLRAARGRREASSGDRLDAPPHAWPWPAGPPSPAACTSGWRTTSKFTTPRARGSPLGSRRPPRRRHFDRRDRTGSLGRRRRQSPRLAIRCLRASCWGRIGQPDPAQNIPVPGHQPLLRPGRSEPTAWSTSSIRGCCASRATRTTAIWNGLGQGIAGVSRFLRLLQPGPLGRAARRPLRDGRERHSAGEDLFRARASSRPSWPVRAVDRHARRSAADRRGRVLVLDRRRPRSASSNEEPASTGETEAMSNRYRRRDADSPRTLHDG